jgi:hypothetical protein
LLIYANLSDAHCNADTPIRPKQNLVIHVLASDR